MENPTVIGALIIAVYGLVELGKYALQKGQSSEYFGNEDRANLKEACEVLRVVAVKVDRTLDMHDKTDKDGLYLWYSPREWGEIQKELLAEVRSSNRLLAKVISVLETRAENAR